MISEPMLRSSQTVHHGCTRLTLSPNGPKQAFTWPVSPRSPIGSAQNDFWVYWTFSSQTVHISCMEINTISKQSKTSFWLTHITKEVHWVRPKIFLWPWYIQRKPCTYLTLRLTSSPSKPKWASTCPKTTRSSIGCTQNNFWAYCMSANRAPILHWD
jgi:hypothetical protein